MTRPAQIPLTPGGLPTVSVQVGDLRTGNEMRHSSGLIVTVESLAETAYATGYPHKYREVNGVPRDRAGFRDVLVSSLAADQRAAYIDPEWLATSEPVLFSAGE